MYLFEFDNDIIDLAIFTRGKDGQIVADKYLCSYIIYNAQEKEYEEINSFDFDFLLESNLINNTIIEDLEDEYVLRRK